MDENLTFISATDAAKIANVTKETIRNLCKAGTIRYQMHGNFFYPCKEDVERYAADIAEIHHIERDIKLHKRKLENELEQLRQARKETQEQLETTNIFPSRIKRIKEILCALIPRFEHSLTPRQIEIVMGVLQGGKWSDLPDELRLPQSRIMDIWEKVLDRLANVPNELDLMEETIDRLTEELAELKDVKAEKEKLDSLTQEERELLMKPIDGSALSIRAQNGLKSADISNVYQLTQLSHNDLSHIRNFGKKSIAEIEAWLASQGLELRH